jgi:cytidine deaminase
MESVVESIIDDATRDELIEQAKLARDRAYTPYSQYKVGAALLTADGTIYSGCNVENAGYTASVCAERVAIFKAVADGVRDFAAIAVVTENGGAPCGICRQVMREFALSLTVIIADMDDNARIVTLRHLLPDSFGPENLPRP